MEGVGIVRKVDNNKIIVEFVRQSACGESCATCSAKCAESEVEFLEFNNNISAKQGDLVKIKNNTKNILSYKFLVYGLPLILFMTSTSAAYFILNKYSINNTDLISLIVGIISLVIAFIIIKSIDNKYKKSTDAAILLEKL